MDLRRGILAAVDQVVINLKNMSRPIQTTGIRIVRLFRSKSLTKLQLKLPKLPLSLQTEMLKLEN